MTGLVLLHLRISLCLCSGVLACFSADCAYADVTNACAYALLRTSLKRPSLVGIFDFC